MLKSQAFFSFIKGVTLATVSGTATTKPALISWFDKEIPDVGIITTKSFQVVPNAGNREPVICETSTGCFGNSVGLRNCGMEQALVDLKEVKSQGFGKWLNVSVSADNPQDFGILVKAFDSVADSIELNFSCPHAKKGFGASIGCDAQIASFYVSEIRKACPNQKSLLFVKLTPNVSDIGSIAKAVVNAGADGICAINTVGPVQHVDPCSGKSILQNSIGGKSGTWVFETALSAVRSIRSAVGPEVPIIGMGGVSSGSDVAMMLQAGANAVGIGSALARVNQKIWPLYFQKIRNEASFILMGKQPIAESLSMLDPSRKMEYHRHVIVSKELKDENTALFVLQGQVSDFEAGKFVFLWIPGVGEKPFSVAKTEPLTFIVRKKGTFTAGLFDLDVGSEVFIRGCYGASVDCPKANKAIIIAGGTGEAVAYPLALKLNNMGQEVSTFVGSSGSCNTGLMQKELSQLGSYTFVKDDGVPGRILQFLPEKISNDKACYLIGPEIFMSKGAKLLCSKGANPALVLLSMEKNSMCGVGLCGECACGERLACQWGTFMSFDFLSKEGVL